MDITAPAAEAHNKGLPGMSDSQRNPECFGQEPPHLVMSVPAQYTHCHSSCHAVVESVLFSYDPHRSCDLDFVDNVKVSTMHAEVLQRQGSQCAMLQV